MHNQEFYCKEFVLVLKYTENIHKALETNEVTKKWFISSVFMFQQWHLSEVLEDIKCSTTQCAMYRKLKND